jgi:hypothetical protein
LFFGYGATGDLLMPVASVFPVASGMLLDVLPQTGQIKRFDPVKFRFVGVE